MHSGVSLCPDLQSKAKCFKVRRYHQGVFVDEFHEHVPRHRINAEETKEAIRALVIRFAMPSGSAILQALLNRRRNRPAASGLLNVLIDYPEPGVVRKACGGDVIAWVDEVVNEREFRQTAQSLGTRPEKSAGS
jgi:hypothetical protein